MLIEVLFIGDEVTAAGFRLAGVTVITPDKEKLHEVLAKVCDQASLILITAEFMEALDSQLQKEYMMKVSPMIVVIADINNSVPVKDLAVQVRRTLGILE
jgi:vacuolar-type H+-ATPase subunit F/Vma7